MSLAGRGVLVTRPLAQSARLLALLADAGARPEHFPVLRIEPCPLALDALEQSASDADWLIFISPSAIDIAWPRLRSLPPKVRLATVGAASAAALARRSGRPVLHPTDASDSAALLALPEFAAPAGSRIVVVRGSDGRAEPAATLAARGATVVPADVYRRQDGEPDWQHFDRLHAGGHLDAVVITSGEIAERMFRLAGPARGRTLQCLQYCVPHPRIAERLASLGAARIVTTRADDAAIVAGLSEWFLHHP
ncbi:uroporphyrinogen-III synthase [Paludibacterium yongneupense]|uniref:uroporphyrinogen-III synthase n=1 Tax=Paludibacterium yongneupense TaxID=400061 RepID=UPI0003FC677C|nr:uroporphyrinogen-III synthase [Paludibacterium yongneupense]